MSRSLWALAKSCAVGVACRAVRLNQVQTAFGYQRLRTASSHTPLIWVVAATMLTLTPAALGKAGNPHAQPLVVTSPRTATTVYASLQPSSRNSNPSPTAGGSAEDRSSSAKALTIGSGYATPHGSPAVRALQQHLATLGYAPGPIDGRYGPLTERAVVHFQATHGLVADGTAGIRTLAALAAAKPVLYPGQGYGPTGSGEVRSLQRNLAAAGFSPGPIDGRYGPRTARAVARFQVARHLRVDGIAGPQTLDRLHLRPTPHTQHRVPTQTPTPRRTHPVPVRPGGAPRAANHAPQAANHAPPAANHAPQAANHAPQAANHVPPTTGHSRPKSSGFPVVWIIVLALLLLAFLAWQLLRRRAVDRGSDARHIEGANNGQRESARTTADAHMDEQQGAAAFRLGLLMAQEGDRVGAEDAFRRAADRGHADAAYELGGLLVQEGDGPGAEAAFRRADERGHPRAAFDLGVLLLQQGNHDGAKEAFRRAEEHGHPSAAFDLGALLLQEGDHVAAEKAFRRADQRGDAGSACNLGVLLEQRGDVLGAKEAYQRADERGHRVGACNLGALLEQQGEMAAAKAAYQRADQRGDSTGAYQFGVLLEREGDRDAAKEAYLRADRRGHPAGACHLGMLLKDEGDHPGAVRAFRRAGERGSPEVVTVARAALLELDPDEEGQR